MNLKRFGKTIVDLDEVLSMCANLYREDGWKVTVRFRGDEEPLELEEDAGLDAKRFIEAHETPTKPQEPGKS